MKHVFRFLAAPTADGKWLVEGEEHQHLAKVVRLAVGDALEVMDGRGHVVAARVAAMDGKRALVEAAGEARYEAPPRPPFHVGVGALKPQSVDEILPALTELGVDVVDVFMQEGTAKFRGDDKYRRRWERIVLNAAKQSKRAWLPELRVWDSVEALVDDWAGLSAVHVLEPGRGVSPFTVGVPAGAYGVLVGGEKGFSDVELEIFANRGWGFINLGPFILRATTACVTAAALLSLRRHGGEAPGA